MYSIMQNAEFGTNKICLLEIWSDCYAAVNGKKDCMLFYQQIGLFYFLKAKYAALQDTKSVYFCCNALGDLYRMLESKDVAEKFYSEAIGIDSRQGKPFAMLAVMKSDIEEALYLFCKSLCCRLPFSSSLGNMLKFCSMHATENAHCRLILGDFSNSLLWKKEEFSFFLAFWLHELLFKKKMSAKRKEIAAYWQTFFAQRVRNSADFMLFILLWKLYAIPAHVLAVDCKSLLSRPVCRLLAEAASLQAEHAAACKIIFIHLSRNAPTMAEIENYLRKYF